MKFLTPWAANGRSESDLVGTKLGMTNLQSLGGLLRLRPSSLAQGFQVGSVCFRSILMPTSNLQCKSKCIEDWPKLLGRHQER